MWRVYLLRGYAVVLGVGLFVLGVVGLWSNSPNLAAPESLLHIGGGLLFFFGGLLLAGFRILRFFVGGMGLLEVFGKVFIVGMHSFDLGFIDLPLVGVVCMIAGLSALLMSLCVSIGTPPRDD